GEVPDYVHFHDIELQLIFCAAGWVRVVYEDQGEPFVLHAGDCVLQPPGIRHRVLESGPGLEVIEISSPAEHETLADLEMALPTPRMQPDRDFGGQRFVRHEAALASWSPWRGEGFEARDLGIDAATGGLAGAQVVRSLGASHSPATRHDAEVLFTFVLAGKALLESEGNGHEVHAGDSFVVPAGLRHALAECSRDLQILEVSLPARFAAARD
ncbi:MAG TPA: cupin domain-containing protein, partial [Vicinamibacteria bacterium]|nr:cupin domain-containing protein [Vicinamibacteria bacterium]